MNIPAIFPAPLQDQDENRLCCIEIPSIISYLCNGRRNGTRNWKRKDRDSKYWQRVYEYPNLNDEERLLAYLKAIDGLPWKEIVAKFNTKMGLEMRQPALQMRLTRLAFRMDVSLHSYHGYLAIGLKANSHCVESLGSGEIAKNTRNYLSKFSNHESILFNS